MRGCLNPPILCHVNRLVSPGPASCAFAVAAIGKCRKVSESVRKCQVTHGIDISCLSHDHHEFTSPKLPDRCLRSHFPPSEAIDDGRFPNLSTEPFCSGSTWVNEVQQNMAAMLMLRLTHWGSQSLAGVASVIPNSVRPTAF